MNAQQKIAPDFSGYEVGYDIPALPGMDEADIQTPCLILDLDALERNIRKMGDYARAHGMRHRSHGKMHKSVDVQKLQESLGGVAGEGLDIDRSVKLPGSADGRNVARALAGIGYTLY